MGSDGDDGVLSGRPILDHVQVAAPPGCEAAARRFYGQVLGLAELEKPAALRAGGGAWFQLHGSQLHVGVQPAFTPALKAHPALRVALGDLDGLARRLQAAGAPVAWEQADELPGMRRFFTADPWGNRIELLAAAATDGSAD